MTEIELKNGHIVRQIKKLKNKVHQLSILAPILMDSDLWELRPIVEYWLKIKETNEKYRVDLYYPQIGLIIEINESYHKSDSQKLKDSKREEKIKNELGCDFYHINIFETGFVHIEKITELKKDLKVRVENLIGFIPWSEKSFEIEKAVEDDPNLIFVNKGKSNNPFPPFQLSKELQKNKDLKIAMLVDSSNQIENKNLKAIDCVYDVTYVNGAKYKNGFVDWSGITTAHSITLSGETNVKLTNNVYHSLFERNRKNKNAKKRRK